MWLSLPLFFRDQERIFGHDVLVTDPQGGKGPQWPQNPIPAPNITDQLFFSCLIHSLSSQKKLDKTLPPHTHEGTHHLPGQTIPTLGHSNCEKLLDGVQMKSDTLQFHTAANVSVLQGYTEQC